MKPSSISARLVGLMAALMLIVSALAAPPALAKAACNTTGAADIALVQAVSVASDNNFVDHLTITNYGPCNVPNAGLTVKLPGGAVYKGFSSNPSSWSCEPGTSIAPSQPPDVDVSCWETSTIGVPGTADIYIEYQPVAGGVVACAATFSATPPPTFSPTSCNLAGEAVPDLFPLNNKSTVVAGLLGSGETLTYGPTVGGPLNGLPDPNGSSNEVDHTTTVGLSNGGLVNIYQTSSDKKNCPPSVNDCFLGTATINFTSVGLNNPKTWTLTFLASLTKKSLSQITVWNSVGGGAYTALTNCSGKNRTDPCVSSRSKSTNSNGDTIFTIVVTGTKDNGMTAD